MELYRREPKSRLLSAGLIALFALTSQVVASQQPGTNTDRDTSTAAWAIGSYDGQADQARDQVSAVVQDGLVPVGLSMAASGDFEILYARTPRISVEAWRLVTISAEELEEQLTAALQSGWIPTGLSKRPNNPFVFLFVRSAVAPSGWRLTSSETTTEAVQETIAKFREEGFGLWGLSVSEERAWHLFLETEDVSAGNVVLDRLPEEPETLRSLINSRIADGRTPWSYSRAPFGPIMSTIPTAQ